MSYTLDRYKSRKELLLTHISELSPILSRGSTLVEVFATEDSIDSKYEAAKWLKGVLTAKLDHVEELIASFEK